MGLFNKKATDESRNRRSRSSGKNPVYSYYNNRDQESDSNATQVRKKQSRLGHIKDFFHSLPGYIAVVVILGCILYSFSLTTNPKIIIVNDQEQSVQPFLRTSQAYQDAVSKQLASSLLNRTKLGMNTAKVEAQIKEQLPEVGEASITLPIIGRNPVVYLRIAEPAFVLQPEYGDAYVVDEQGRAVVPASQLPDLEHNLVKIQDKSGLPIEQAKNVLPADQIAFLQEINAQFESANIKIKQFTLPAEANSLRAYPGGKPYYVKFSFSGDAREQAGRYLAARAKIKPLQYVDVRVSERVYVR